MKNLIGLQALVGIYFIYECSGQYADDVKKNFVFMTLEVKHRGTFNNTRCSRELMNCWENIKPELICTHWLVYESLCGVLRRECTDAAAFAYLNPLRDPIYEGFCHSFE